LEHTIVPSEVGVIVGRHRVATDGAQLPLRDGFLELGVERHERLVRHRHCWAGGDGIELCRHQALVLASSFFRQRPPCGSAELGTRDPTGCSKVLEGGLDGGLVESEPSRDSSSVGEAQYPYCVQRQRRGM
jgi:hypothetical protein